MALEFYGFKPVILRLLESRVWKVLDFWGQSILGPGMCRSLRYRCLVLTRAESSIFCSKSARAELYFSTERRRLSAAFLVLVSA